MGEKRLRKYLSNKNQQDVGTDEKHMTRRERSKE